VNFLHFLRNYLRLLPRARVFQTRFAVNICFSPAIFPQIRAGCCNAKEKIYTCLALKEELFPYKY